MNTALLSLLTPAIIPESMRSSCLCWFDRTKLERVNYGLNQKVTNGLPVNTTGWVHYTTRSAESVVDGWLRSTKNTDFPYFGREESYNIASGHNVYVRFKIRGNKSGVSSDLTLCTAGIGLTDVGHYYNFASATSEAMRSAVFTTTGVANGFYISGAEYSTDGDYLEVKEVEIYDLGDSNSALYNLTAPELDAILAADGTAYWEGTKQVNVNPLNKYFWHDYSGNARHMKLSNLAYTALSTLSGQNGFEVDGVDDYGSIADSAATRLTAGGTLVAWIKPFSMGENGGGRIFDKGVDASSTNGFFFGVTSFVANSLAFTINAGPVMRSPENSVVVNKWQRVGVTFGSGGRHIYINGVDATASGGSETALPPDVAGIVAIGNRAGGTDRTFYGDIDKAGMFTKVWTPNDFRMDFENGRRFYGV